MSNVYQLPPNGHTDKDVVFDQASEWIAKLDRELSAQEQTEFKAWLATSQSHVDTFTQMAKLWDKMDALQNLAELFPDEAPVHSQPKKNTWHLAVAASIFMTLCLGLLMQPGQQWIEERSTVMYQTAVGESSTIVLDDNSKVLLNTNSILNVRYTDEYRLLELVQGELHVDVAHDSNRPLSVVANGKIIQAVGTAFNVQVNKYDVELIVTDGKVVIADIEEDEALNTESLQLADNIEVAVTKGEKASLKPEEITHIVEKIEVNEISDNLSWRSGNLIFKGETLDEALAEISRYTSVKFRIAEPTLHNIKIAGRFKTGDVDGLLMALNSNFNIDTDRVNKKLVVLKKAI